MNEIKKINPLPFLSTLEANPERDEWIKQREKELAEQAEKEAAYQMQKKRKPVSQNFPQKTRPLSMESDMQYLK